MKLLVLVRVTTLAIGGIVTVGCASLPPPNLSAESIHCYRSKVDRYRIGPCTAVPVPNLSADAAAKQLQPDPRYLIVYVVRQSWGDGQNVIPVNVNKGVRVETLPDTFVRFRLKPGSHELAFEFEGKLVSTTVAGGAGELRLVRLGGTAWAWGSHYQWENDPQGDIRQRVGRARLIADLPIT